MSIKYFVAPDVKRIVEEIVHSLNFSYISSEFVYCFRSKGSKSKRVIARIHGLGHIWQEALHLHPTYIIEVLSERYDTLSEAEKKKILIHELLHIPQGFSGGFRPHRGYINRQRVEHLYAKLQRTQTSTRYQSKI